MTATPDPLRAAILGDGETPLTEAIARAICRESCAYRGEPACFLMEDDRGRALPWPNPECDEPGCHALATAAAARVRAMMTSPEAVERVAIALYEHEEDRNEVTEKELGVDLGRRFTWAEHAKRWPETAEAYRSRARAAILALLGDPT